MNMYKVLWIDDSALWDRKELASPLYEARRFTLHVATDATDAIAKLKQDQYAAVIMDIRIPPGKDTKVEAVFEAKGGTKVSARLGLEILRSMLDPDRATLKIDDVPQWISPRVIGVLSVETEQDIVEDLNTLGITVHHVISANTTSNSLLELLESIVQQRESEEVATSGSSGTEECH